MPRPTDPRATYLPGLNGVRALAVAVVVLLLSVLVSTAVVDPASLSGRSTDARAAMVYVSN